MIVLIFQIAPIYMLPDSASSLVFPESFDVYKILLNVKVSDIYNQTFQVKCSHRHQQKHKILKT